MRPPGSKIREQARSYKESGRRLRLPTPAVTRPAIISDTIATPPPGSGAATNMTAARNTPRLSPTPRALAGSACMLVASLWLAAPACAGFSADNGPSLWLAQAAPTMSAEQAAALVRASSGGRILGVRRVNSARGVAYHVKVLLDGGRVRVYVVDAGSGQILR